MTTPMNTATATTPHGTFTKKKTKHTYVAVVMWRRPAQTVAAVSYPAWTDSNGVAQPAYTVPERTYPEAIFPTWHRAGSKLPTSHHGCQRIGVFAVESVPA